MPQPPLPDVPGREAGRVDPPTGRNAAQRTVFPCGLYLAAGVERALSVAPKTALQPAFQMLRRNGESFFKRPEIPGCEVRHDGGPAHMGAEHGPAPAPALHRPGRGGDEGGQVENDAFGREIPLSPQCPAHGLQGQIYVGAESGGKNGGNKPALRPAGKTVQKEMGGLCQAPVPGPGGGDRIPGQVHAQGRHFELPDKRRDGRNGGL